MSRAPTIQKTIFVIYNRTDGCKWPPYLKKLFATDKERGVSVVSLKDERMFFSSTSRRGSTAFQLRPVILVVVLTPEHLKFLKNNPNADYKQTVVSSQHAFSPDYSCIIMLGIEEKELKDVDKSGQPLERRFESYPRWSKFSYSNAESIMAVSSEMYARMENEGLDRNPINGRIVYNTLKCNEEATVAIVLEKEVPVNSTAQVYLNFPGNPSNTAVKTQILNPYTVSFTAKERFEGEANVLVTINGSEVRLLPTSQIRFVSSANDVFANSQIYIKFIERILRKSVKDKTSISQMDEALSLMFTQDEMLAVPSLAFEQLFGVLVDVSGGSLPYPTILHLTAEFGLREWTSKLVDLPDAKLALQMANADNKLPEDIAREKGHQDLANFLESSRITELDDLYINRIKMLNAFDTDDRLLDARVRQIRAEAANEDHYDYQLGTYMTTTAKVINQNPSSSSGFVPPLPKKSSTIQSSTIQSSTIQSPTNQSPTVQSPTKSKVFPRTSNQEGSSEFYSQLQEVMQRFMGGEMDMAQTEMAFSKMKFNFQNGCNTFKQKFEKTNKMREELLRAKTNVIPGYEANAIAQNGATFKSSREYLIRKPTSFQTSSEQVSAAPPLPSRSSRTSRNDQPLDLCKF